jgi:hypothetical protein
MKSVASRAFAAAAKVRSSWGPCGVDPAHSYHTGGPAMPREAENENEQAAQGALRRHAGKVGCGDA